MPCARQSVARSIRARGATGEGGTVRRSRAPPQFPTISAASTPTSPSPHPLPPPPSFFAKQVGFHTHGNRGPLLFDAAVLQELQFFDENHYFQGNDDIDLFNRMVVLLDYRVTFYPVAMYAPREFKPKHREPNREQPRFSVPSPDSLAPTKWYGHESPGAARSIEAAIVQGLHARGVQLNRVADSPTAFSNRDACCNYYRTTVAASGGWTDDPFHTSRCCEPQADPSKVWPDRPAAIRIPDELLCSASDVRILGRVDEDLDRIRQNKTRVLREALAVTLGRDVHHAMTKGSSAMDGLAHDGGPQPPRESGVRQDSLYPPDPASEARRPPLDCGLMRGRWDEELIFTPTAREILKLQLHHPLCNLAKLPRTELEQMVQTQPLVEGRPLNNGLGSDLHTWTAMLCHAVSRGAMLVLDPKHHWIWSHEAETAELGGYFAPTHCNVSLDDVISAAAGLASTKDLVEPLYHVRDVLPLEPCLPPWDPSLTTSEWRAAAVEFLFRHLGPDLHRKVCQAFYQVFGPMGGVPRDRLITIHMRWGDKYKEMPLQSEQKYLDAAERIMRSHNMREPYFFLMT